MEWTALSARPVVRDFDPGATGLGRLGKSMTDASIGVERGLVIELEAGILPLLAQDAIAGDQKLDLRAHEAAERVLGGAHDRLATHVEAGVDQHRAAGARLEGREQI